MILSFKSADTEALARMVEENSEEGQVIFASDGSFGNLITGLTGRPATGGMFREVQSEGTEGRGGDTKGGIQDAYLLVFPSRSGKLISRSDTDEQASFGGDRLGLPLLEGTGLDSLDYVGSAGGYCLYRNPDNADVRTAGPGTVVPWSLVFPVLALAVAVIIVDMVRPVHPLAGRKRAGDVPAGTGNAPPSSPGRWNGGGNGYR